jgi:hypothetical protein
MWQVSKSDLELAVKSGFIYAPLLFDPGIEKELNAAEDEGTCGTGSAKATIAVDGTIFIKTVSLNSLLDNYEQIDPSTYEELRSDLLREYSDVMTAGRTFLVGKLKTIVFEIMPYFIKKGRGLDRRRLSEEEMLDLISKKIGSPRRHLKEANALLDAAVLRRALKNLEAQNLAVEPPDDGPLSVRDLHAWLRKGLQARIVECEKERLRQAMLEREQFGEQLKYMCILQHVAEEGSLEIDGFGFSRIGSDDEYFVYKHTGEYILKDYYARPYLFPDCRVAVSTNGVLKPIVMERYKHPFLQGFESGQEICMRGITPKSTFTANHVIEALEEGINALLYGYDSRRRNGYNSLDRTTVYVKPSVDFDDYRV